MTGIRNNEALAEGLNIIMASLKNGAVAGHKEPKVAVTNIVCSYDLGKSFNLNNVVVTPQC